MALSQTKIDKSDVQRQTDGPTYPLAAALCMGVTPCILFPSKRRSRDSSGEGTRKQTALVADLSNCRKRTPTCSDDGLHEHPTFCREVDVQLGVVSQNGFTHYQSDTPSPQSLSEGGQGEGGGLRGGHMESYSTHC